MRANKYGNVKTTVDGIIFSSQREAKRYAELKLLEKAHVIRDLRLQPRYPFEVNGVKVCTYVADFSYVEPGGPGVGSLVVEDAKGYKTPEYRLKAKLFRAVMGFAVTEV